MPGKHLADEMGRHDLALNGVFLFFIRVDDVLFVGRLFEFGDFVLEFFYEISFLVQAGSEDRNSFIHFVQELLLSFVFVFFFLHQIFQGVKNLFKLFVVFLILLRYGSQMVKLLL